MAVWSDENASAKDDHGNFCLPQRRLRRSVKDHLWLVPRAAVSVVVWVADRAAVAGLAALRSGRHSNLSCTPPKCSLQKTWVHADTPGIARGYLLQ